MSQREKTPFAKNTPYTYDQYHQVFQELGAEEFEAEFSTHRGIYERIFREASAQAIGQPIINLRVGILKDNGQQGAALIWADYRASLRVDISIGRHFLIGWMTERNAVVKIVAAMIEALK